MEENNNKPEMEFPEGEQSNPKKELTPRSMLRIVGLILGIYWIGRGFWGLLSSGH